MRFYTDLFIDASRKVSSGKDAAPVTPQIFAGPIKCLITRGVTNFLNTDFARDLSTLSNRPDIRIFQTEVSTEVQDQRRNLYGNERCCWHWTLEDVLYYCCYRCLHDCAMSGTWLVQFSPLLIMCDEHISSFLREELRARTVRGHNNGSVCR